MKQLSKKQSVKQHKFNKGSFEATEFNNKNVEATNKTKHVRTNKCATTQHKSSFEANTSVPNQIF